MNGFYVPGSASSSYVANKRNEQGSLLYESLASDVGIQKQAAMQQLDKTYAQTIENAYSSYLASNRAVNSSYMGQGYKDLYKQINQAQLQQNIANTSIQLSQQRAELNQQEAEAQAQIQEQFSTEVGYFDRLQSSFTNYLQYVKTLTDEEGNPYLDKYEQKASVDSMYDLLYSSQPQNYRDTEGAAALPFTEWLNANYGTTKEDQEWYRWAISGGLNEFMQAPKEMKQLQKGEIAAAAKQRQDELDAINNRFNEALFDNNGKIIADDLKQKLSKYIPTDKIGRFEVGRIFNKKKLGFNIRGDLTSSQLDILKELGFTVQIHQNIGANAYRPYWQIETKGLSKEELKSLVRKMYTKLQGMESTEVNNG